MYDVRAPDHRIRHMLAAPDIARSTDEVLTPALEGLVAYTHGLQRASGA